METRRKAYTLSYNILSISHLWLFINLWCKKNIATFVTLTSLSTHVDFAQTIIYFYDSNLIEIATSGAGFIAKSLNSTDSRESGSFGYVIKSIFCVRPQILISLSFSALWIVLEEWLCAIVIWTAL